MEESYKGKNLNKLSDISKSPISTNRNKVSVSFKDETFFDYIKTIEKVN